MSAPQPPRDEIIAKARELIDAGMLQSIAQVVLLEPTPSGAEKAAALRLQRWGSRHAPELGWEVQDLGAGRANLLAWTGVEPWQRTAGTWLYGHLDHTLSGDPVLDRDLTGHPATPTAPRITEDAIRGLGVAVSRGPAICALAAACGLAAAAAATGSELTVGVLLSAGGTHRWPPPELAEGTENTPVDSRPGIMTGMGMGVRAALGTGWRPSAVLNVKGGCPGVLSAEPGNLMLQATWQQRFTAMPARGSEGGSAVVCSILALAVEDWRSAYYAVSEDGQLACDLCVGCVRSGLRYKTDLQPGYAEVGVYLSTLPGADADEVADRLDTHLRQALNRAGVRPSEGRLRVTAYAGEPAGATGESEMIVRAARSAWHNAGYGDSRVRAYRGSTDGNLFRAVGIPTARFGPTARPDDNDPTVEELKITEMLTFARMFVETVARPKPAPTCL